MRGGNRDRQYGLGAKKALKAKTHLEKARGERQGQAMSASSVQTRYLAALAVADVALEGRALEAALAGQKG